MPTEIHAYDATSFATELWNSGQRSGGADNLDSTVKFASPTVANGEVFVGTNDSLVVYGATSLAGITISGIVVAEATPQNGILESNEQGVLTWAALTTNPIASVALAIDGQRDQPDLRPLWSQQRRLLLWRRVRPPGRRPPQLCHSRHR